MFSVLPVEVPSQSLRLPRPATTYLVGDDNWPCSANHHREPVTWNPVLSPYQQGARLFFNTVSAAPEPSPPVSECLAGFLRLVQKSDVEIFRYAATWGPLGIEQAESICWFQV